MKASLLKLRRDDAGLSTAEYAVGTVAVVGLGGLLIRLLSSDIVFSLLKRVFEFAFQAILG
jgi:Flp pilus assembly pilin Flp